MMKAMCVVLMLTVSLCGVSATAEQLVVYTYDSFVAWGPAQAIKEAFEEAHPGVDLVWIAPGDSSEMLARVIGELALGLPTADVLLGTADVEIPRALANEVFRPLESERLSNLEHVPQELRLMDDAFVVPFDYGYVTFIYDEHALPEAHIPQSFEDLLRPELKDKIILQDPRMASPGLSFLAWTVDRFGDAWPDFWRALLPNVLTVTSGWTESFEMFEAGEAPIVISYSTDEAYAKIVFGDVRYRVLTLEGQACRQVEYMGLVRTTEKTELAHALLDIVLSEDIQVLIPTTQWMFPANAAVTLPEDFETYAVVPDVPVYPDLELIGEQLATWISTWQEIVVGR